MSATSTSGSGQPDDASHRPPTENSDEPGQPSCSDLTQAVAFSSGNPRIEVTRGVMRLFCNPSEPLDALAHHLPVGRSPLLCVLDVPNHMNYADFCQFCGSVIQHILEMRIVRNDGMDDHYSVLIRFDNQNSADSFYHYFNQRCFSSLEVEVCNVLFTVDVQYTGSTEHAQTSAVGSMDLPNCPVCLEKLDNDVSGTLTTICNHSFHCSCISKWTDSSCPKSEEVACDFLCCLKNSSKAVVVAPYGVVCHSRFADIACSSLRNQGVLSVIHQKTCGCVFSVALLGVEGNYFFFLYREGHAIRHWKETQHCYALELETQRVWDYVGDNYVHRLIQSKTDGKLVELNFHCRTADDSCGSCECSEDSGMSEALFNSKVEAIVDEYNDLLTSQLENQRKYFSSLLLEVKEETDRAITEAVEKSVSLRLQKMQGKLQKCSEERQFLNEINENLLKNQEIWNKKLMEIEERERLTLKSKDDKIRDLEEQLGDLMILIEAQKTSDQLPDSSGVNEGTILPLPSESSQGSTRRSPRSSRRK
ncbi:BRCA1-associated protein [Nymphaea thermarum]|nr:BRCA1-associated protein [Nymphaea thermarum]